MYTIIDTNGFALYAQQTQPEIGINYTEINCTEKFIKPKFNGKIWIEGATILEQSIAKNKKITTLQNSVNDKIILYAEAFSMGKTVTENLKYYREAYINKYEMAKGTLADTNGLLLLEANIKEVTLDEYKLYVIASFEAGKDLFKTFMQMAEVVRKKVLKDVLNNDFDKAIQRLEIIDTLPPTTRPDEIQAMFFNLMNLQ